MFEQGGALILPKMVSPPSRPAVWASETSSDMVHSALRGGVAARRVSNNGAIGKRAADRRSMPQGAKFQFYGSLQGFGGGCAVNWFSIRVVLRYRR